MKKTALSLSVLFSLLSACMVGCDVTSKKVDGKEVLFTVDGTNVYADDLSGFDSQDMSYDFLSTDEGVQAVYEAVFKVLAQKNVEITSTIDGAVEEKMEEWDEQVESYASSNGVTKNAAMNTKLEELGFEDEAELKASYYVEEQKEELLEMYKDSMMEPSNTTTLDGKSMLERYVTNASPMVVRHILSKVSDSSTIYSKASVTSDEMKNFANIIKELAIKSNTFAKVAEESEDTSASEAGNLGIVDTYTSFVQEFKLGLYAYEIVQNHDIDTNDTFGAKAYADELFGSEGVYANYGVESIDVIALASVLNYVADDEAKDEQVYYEHTKQAEYDEDLYPRNVIYNKYLNYPGIRYLKADTATAEASIKALLEEVYPHSDTATISKKVSEVLAGTVYQAFSNELRVDTNNLLVDDNDKPFFVAKSTYGFHIISVTYNSLEQTQLDAVKYFMYGSNASTTDKSTYVKNSDLNADRTKSTTVYQNARKSEIEGRVLNYIKGGFEGISTDDKIYENEIYSYYVNLNGIEYANDTLKNAVNDSIELTKELKVAAIEEQQQDNWAAYIEKLEAYNEAYGLFYTAK